MSCSNDHGYVLRRDFVKLLSSVVGTLSIPGARSRSAKADDLKAQRSFRLDGSWLESGLNALARAHQMSSMAGHLGASLIAGYFVAVHRPNLDHIVYKGIEADLERVVRGESVFGKRMSKKSRLADPELFEPFPKQKPDENLIGSIAEELEKGIDKPRQSGHNVIFGSLAIRALNERPELATPAVIDGIIKLMALFSNATPGSGYYGKEKGRIHGDKITLADDDGIPEYNDIEGMAIAVLNEMIDQKPEIHRIGYGSLVHIINHAAAITDLADSGYVELVPRAVRSHHQHLRLWRSLPNVADEKGPLQVSKFTPHVAEYWTSGNIPYDRALLTHRVKTMFGFDALASAVDEKAQEEAAYDKLRYLM